MYKNWDNLRDHRIYAYANQRELDIFLEAMRLRDMSQQGTAARQFIIERSQQIIDEHSKKNQQPSVTVNYRFPGAKFTT